MLEIVIRDDLEKKSPHACCVSAEMYVAFSYVPSCAHPVEFSINGINSHVTNTDRHVLLELHRGTAQTRI
jgi:hypothetical protein